MPGSVDASSISVIRQPAWSCERTLSTQRRTSSGALCTGTTMSIENSGTTDSLAAQPLPQERNAQERQLDPPSCALAIRDDPLLCLDRARQAALFVGECLDAVVRRPRLTRRDLE